MESLKSITRKLRIKRYYNIRIKNGMGYMASIMDKIIFRLFIFLSLFTYLYIKLESLFATLALSTIFITAYLLISHRSSDKKLRRNIEIIDNDLIIEKVYKKLMSKSTDSYIEYVKEILDIYGVKNMKNTIRKDLDIIGNIGGEKVGIKCYQYNEEHQVEKNNMKNFFIEIREKDIRSGIIITTSSFSEDAKVYFDNMEDIKVKFITIENIIDIIKDTSLYPKKRDIENMILKQLDDNRLKVKDEGKKIISKDNTKKCIISGIVIILFSKITKYTLYYKSVGFLLIILGLIPIIKISINLILSGNTEEDKI